MESDRLRFKLFQIFDVFNFPVESPALKNSFSYGQALPVRARFKLPYLILSEIIEQKKVKTKFDVERMQ